MENWKNILTIEDINSLTINSLNYPQIIFKDSTRCGISAHAKERLIRGYHWLQNKAELHYLDLLNHRDLSNYIADKFGVIHQSPQIIVLKNGQPTYVVSHHAIEPEKISEKI